MVFSLSNLLGDLESASGKDTSLVGNTCHRRRFFRAARDLLGFEV